MSKARHTKKSLPKVAYSGAGSNVIKEAMEKKSGGACKEVDKPDGKKAKARMDKRPRKASGGTTLPPSPFLEIGEAPDKKSPPVRRSPKIPGKAAYASGGRVGSDKSPFSSAANPKQNTEA